MVQVQHLALCLNQVQGLSLTFSVKVVFAVVKVVEAEQASCSSAESRLEEKGCLRAHSRHSNVVTGLLLLVVGIYWALVPDAVLSSFTCSINSFNLHNNLVSRYSSYPHSSDEETRQGHGATVFPRK